MNKEHELRRILFIATQMEARGTNEYISHLASELLRKGFDVAVFCAPGPMLEILHERRIPAKTFKHLAGFRFPSREKREFLKELEVFDPDIVHAPSLEAMKTYNSIAEGYDVPMVVTVHAAPSRPKLFRSIAPDLSGVIVTSQKVREEVVNDLKFSKNKVVMICNGIDLEAVKLNALRPIFSRSVPVIGSVGPVERARGHELFVRAAAIIARAKKKVQFVIAGVGDEVPKLSKMGSKAGLDSQLTFVRDFSSYDEILDALDVVVQSSQVDVSGFSILDAMSHGRPVVTFNTGTACEIVTDKETGLIVRKDDEELLAEALLSIVEDPSWALELGQAAKRRVEDRFNITQTALEIINFYNKILAENV